MNKDHLSVLLTGRAAVNLKWLCNELGTNRTSVINMILSGKINLADYPIPDAERYDLMSRLEAGELWEE